MGRIGGITPSFHGAPTSRNQRHTVAVDCPEILARCRDEGADAAVLVPNCPVCHRTVALVARHVEAGGILTLVMGCAKDAIEICCVPRFLFSNFPLGNATGRPADSASRDATLELAFRVLDAAPAPRTTLYSPLRWTGDASWKLDYCNIERIAPDERKQLRDEFDRQKRIARDVRAQTAAA